MAGFEVSTEALRPMPLRCLLGSCALGSGDAATGELEEDARLTALFLWTLQSTEVPENNGKKEENDQEEVAKVAAKGFSLLDAMLLAVPRRGE